MLLLVWSYVFADGLDCRRVVLGSKCVAELNLPLPLIDIIFCISLFIQLVVMKPAGIFGVSAPV